MVDYIMSGTVMFISWVTTSIRVMASGGSELLTAITWVNLTLVIIALVTVMCYYPNHCSVMLFIVLTVIVLINLNRSYGSGE